MSSAVTPSLTEESTRSNDNVLYIDDNDLERKASHLSAVTKETLNLAKYPSRAWHKIRRSDEISLELDSLDGVTASEDLVTENQRGAFLFGYPLFSGQTLMPFDPGNWVTGSGSEVMSLEEVLLPDITWEWSWNRWYVDMGGEVDDQGWAYSFRFGGNHWYSKHFFFRAFVRKRVWKRLRVKIGSLDQVLQRGRYVRSAFDIRSATDQNYVRSAKAAQLKSSAVVPPIESDAHVTAEEALASDSRLPPAIEEREEEPLDRLEKRLQSSRIDRESIRAIQDFVMNPDSITSMRALLRSNEHVQHTSMSIQSIVGVLKYPQSKDILYHWLKGYEEDLSRSLAGSSAVLSDFIKALESELHASATHGLTVAPDKAHLQSFLTN